MSVDTGDLGLVQRVQKGDKTAFDLLVRKYQHKVVKLVTRYLRVTERNGKAIIEAEAPGLLDKQPKRGTITMVRDGDVWWVETMTF